MSYGVFGAERVEHIILMQVECLQCFLIIIIYTNSTDVWRGVGLVQRRLTTHWRRIETQETTASLPHILVVHLLLFSVHWSIDL